MSGQADGRRPRLLDLFCGAGGAGMGYHLAGFDVTGVDHLDQPDYPFAFVRADAIEYAAAHAHEYDAVHGSPPCQGHSALTQGNRRRPGWSDSHTDLIPATRVALDRAGRPYVLENVEGSPLRRDLILCGLHFGLKVFRHRYFELVGWAVEDPLRCTSRAGKGLHTGHRVRGYRHGRSYQGDMVAPYGDGGQKGSPREWADAMGITWTLNKHGLREAIPPAYTRWVGERLVKVVRADRPPLWVVVVLVVGRFRQATQNLAQHHAVFAQHVTVLVEGDADLIKVGALVDDDLFKTIEPCVESGDLFLRRTDQVP